MRNRTSLIATGLAVLLVAAPAMARQHRGGAGSSPATDTTTLKAAPSTLKAIEIQHLRPQDQRGLTMFEPPKNDGVPFEGFKLDWSAAFAQQFQALSHSNTAAPKLLDGVDANELMDIGAGFNNASANLNLNVQLAPGIRVALNAYLSSRHHNEAWVKDGYLLIDESPIDVAALRSLMQYVTVKAGHFEINYGDAHFRRSDNGNALFNPFVGNYILDAFTTEVGGELYVRKGSLLAMGAVTGGEIKGNILTPDDRSPAFIGKLGFDRQLTDDLRVRVTGSAYTIEKSPANTLYAGDRAGSRYFFVLENTQATAAVQASSGLVNPGFRYKVTAYQLNPFVKVGGLELFGVVEQATGRNAAETTERTWSQYAADAVYRFLPGEKLYVGGRYNVARGELAGISNEVSVDRVQLGAGWFVAPTVLLKGEYVTQKYRDFPITDSRNGGKFNGFVVEGVVAF